MTSQERLERSREELELFKQQVAQNEMVDQTAYQQRIEQLRGMGDLSGGFGDVPQDATTAMALGQLNIERRIAALEMEVQQQPQAIQVPAQQINVPAADAAAPPQAEQAQKPGIFARIKGWFKKHFGSNNDDDGNGNGNGGAPIPPPVDNLELVRNVQVSNHVADVKRFQKASPDDEQIFSEKELKAIRAGGARGSDGQFLARRSKEMFKPSAEKTAEMLDNLEANHFDFAKASSDAIQINTGHGFVEINDTIVAVATKSLQNLHEFLDNEHYQEYIRMMYSGVEKVLLSETKRKRGDDAFPTDEDFDEHIMTILPTRGLETFFSQYSDANLSAERRSFALKCSKVVGKMAYYEEIANMKPEYARILQPIINEFHALRARISEIGAEVRTQRLNEMRNLPPDPPATPNPPPAQ